MKTQLEWTLALTILCTIITRFVPTFAAELSVNGTALKDRININFNQGISQAVGKDGSSSVSQGSSFGYNVGILNNGRYKPIDSKTQAHSNTYSFGKYAPQTYINTGVTNNPSGIKGSVGGGYSGGRGKVQVNSQSQQFKIPLGLGGAVLLSNIQTNSTGDSPVDAKETPIQPPSKEAENNDHLYLMR